MVTREEILKIAKLSKLSVTEEELDGLTAAMGEIIAFADTINAAEPPPASSTILTICRMRSVRTRWFPPIPGMRFSRTWTAGKTASSPCASGSKEAAV